MGVNTWSPEGGTVWAGLCSEASTEEGQNLGQALRVKKPYLPPVFSPCFLLTVQEMSSQLLPLPHACCRHLWN